MFTGAVSAILLAFVGVEKTLKRKQDVIRERQKEACEAEGKTWVEPEIVMEEEQRLADEEAEVIFCRELKERCAKKGLDFEAELAKHTNAMYARAEKQEKKERLAKEKAAEKERLSEEKRAAKLEKMTPEQRAAKSARDAVRREREEAHWEREKAEGEASYRRMQEILKAYREKKQQEE